MRLLIVESPAKERTITQFIGKDYKVISTNGHLFALSKRSGKNQEFGINFKTLEINYLLIPKMQKIFRRIKAAVAEGDDLIFATDNDREGEAIAYILGRKLKIDLNIANRLVFNEISKSSILGGLSNLQKIDTQLVKSQKARRLLDRIIGFRAGKHIMTYYGSHGAGRVQSVVLKFIADLDSEIQRFVPQTYKICRLTIAGEIELTDKKSVVNPTAFSDLLPFVDNPSKLRLQVVKIEKKEKIINPPLPFKTSTLVQEAYLKFGYNLARTMAIAQELYSGVKINKKSYGLITYLRTDSVRISTKFCQNVQKELGQNYRHAAISKKPSQKSKALIQDAHEAIRPVYLSNELSLASIQADLKPQLWKIYKLIYDRTIASFAYPAIKQHSKYSLRIVTPTCNEESKREIDKTIRYTFSLTAAKYKRRGWTKFYYDTTQTSSPALTEFSRTTKIGDDCQITKCEILKKETKPPAFYNQASIIKKMDSTNIGRPSTYSSTIQKLEKHNYILQKQQKLTLTIRGRETNKILQKYYSSIFNADYTSAMEESLAMIREERYDYKKMIHKVNDEMIELVARAMATPRQGKRRFLVVEGATCPECQSEVRLIRSRGVDHLMCSRFQSAKDKLTESKKRDSELIVVDKKEGCTYFRKINYLKVLLIGRKCDLCQADLVVRRNSRRNNLFVGCSGFPKCRKIINCKRDQELQDIIKKLYPKEHVFF